MKNANRKAVLFILFISLIIGKELQAQQQPVQQTEYLNFPFSQYVIRADWGMPIVWKYRPFEDIKENETVIAPPQFDEDWNSWYKKMKNYQSYLRGNLNDTAAMYLQMTMSKGKRVRLHFKRVLNDMRLRPNDKIIFNGFAKNNSDTTRFRINLIYIRIGQQLSDAIVKTESIDSLNITDKWTSLHHEFRLPDFDTSAFMVQPVVFFESDDTKTVEIQVKGLTFSIPSTKLNKEKYQALRPSFYPKSPAIDRQLYDRKEMQWVKSNFVSGFAYLWDHDFWDAEKKVFTVQKYCDKMKKEFGGFQSVLIWYSYPNIGIDERNTWEFLNAIPGGINGLKAVVKTFHDNGVKVYFPYTSWEIDTRRTNTLTDPQNWSKIIRQTDADGLFFDVLFDAGDFQKELDKAKRGISIGTERHPSLQNIQSYNGLTSSWGQTILPYNNNGISRVKWLIPEHIQWKINRSETNRQNTLAYSWINAQGILVWENIFGYMNTWNAIDRQIMRKINAIYQQFGNLYTSDSWKPYLPGGHPKVHISSWENKESKIWNIITDSAEIVNQVELSVSDDAMQYYDLWSGEKLAVINQKVVVPVERFGCVLGIKTHPSSAISALLRKQKKETATFLPATDLHMQFVSAKLAKAPPAISSGTFKIPGNLLKVKAGEYNLVTKHFRREGGCFPDEDGKNNNDYKVEYNSFGTQLIVHHTNITTNDFKIMPRVVTNSEFEVFIKATGFNPKDKVNFLQHWNGKTCPDSIKNKPVVYVSLEDARAFAKWAGMRLPTEWEWQVAGETYIKDFLFNQVFEWNESERFDGHNHFVSLRGGCAGWTLSTSYWYFPGSPNKNFPGGAQALDSHCKYFIMHAGYDRAGTLGFRCVK
jgi:iron(II)-dependent oxidoreductase